MTPLSHAIREAATAPETVPPIMAAYLGSFAGSRLAAQAEECLTALHNRREPLECKA